MSTECPTVIVNKPNVTVVKQGVPGADGVDGVDGLGFVRIDHGEILQTDTEVVDSVPFATMGCIRYWVCFEDTAGERGFVNIVGYTDAAGAAVSKTVTEKMDDDVFFGVDLVINGSDLELQVTNNHSLDFDVVAFKVEVV